MEEVGFGSALDVYFKYALFLNAFLILGIACLTLRYGSLYNYLKNAEKAVKEGRGSYSTEEGPEIARRIKQKALFWYRANCVVLLLSIASFGILFMFIHS